LKVNSQQIKKSSVVLVLTFCVIGTLSGCSVLQSGSNEVKSIAVEPAPNAGFIEQPDRDKKIAYIPFQRAWIKPGFDKSHYKEIVVAPVNTQYMLKMDWLHDMSTASWIGDVKKDIDELAVYFHDQIVKDFEDDPNHRFQVIESPMQHKNRLCVLNWHWSKLTRQCRYYMRSVGQALLAREPLRV